MPRLALIVLASFAALSCASAKVPAAQQTDPVVRLQAAVLAHLFAQRPPGLAYVLCVSGGPPSQQLLDLVQSTVSVRILPCSADTSDISLTTDLWPYRPVARFWVETVTFSGPNSATVQAGYVYAPLRGHGADYKLRRQASAIWVVSGWANEEAARLRPLRGLTPASSGLASLAADARR